jgi:hypothetical protein
MAKSPASILAATLGWDQAEAREHRYQDTRTGRLAIFTVGDDYYTVSKTKPTWDDMDWKEAADQFWAKQSNTILWVAPTPTEEQS